MNSITLLADMDYKKIYNQNYFSGQDSFFYQLGYDRWFQKLYFQLLFQPIKAYIKNLKEAKVLDIGCAYGIMLQKFPKHFEKYGIDISQFAIEKAKQRLPDATLKVTGAEEKFPFQDNFFDIIICNDVIEHIEKPDLLLKNIHQVLKPGGILYINTPNLNWVRRKIFAKADVMEHHISLLSH